MGLNGAPNLVTFPINGIQVVEDDIEEHWDYSGNAQTLSYAYRYLRCNWLDKNALILFLLGGSSLIAGTPFYVSGQVYPYNAAWTAQHSDVKGDGKRTNTGPGGALAYERALVKVKYDTPSWNFGSPNLVGTQELDYSADTVKFSDLVPTFKWSADNAPVETGLANGLKSSTTHFVITRYQVPAIPYAAIVSLLDTVNNALFYGAIAGQARFIGGRSTRNITAAGAYAWDVSYQFEVCSVARANGGGWNAHYRPLQGWQTITDANTGNPFYGSGNFAQLFNT